MFGSPARQTAMTFAPGLPPRVRNFIEAVLAAHPEWEAFVQQSLDAEGCPTASVDVMGPSGKEGMHLGVFFVGDEPSLGLGTWHTHAGLTALVGEDCDGALLRMIEDIVTDRLVLLRDLASAMGYSDVVDATNPDEVLDVVTSPHAPAVIALESWSGRLDVVYGGSVERRS